jgi:hypothetical protein
VPHMKAASLKSIDENDKTPSATSDALAPRFAESIGWEARVPHDEKPVLPNRLTKMTKLVSSVLTNCRGNPRATHP